MTATFSLKSGYAYRLDEDGEWETVVLPKREEGNRNVFSTVTQIDGVPCVAFEGGDGWLYAQTMVMALDRK